MCIVTWRMKCGNVDMEDPAFESVANETQDVSSGIRGKCIPSGNPSPEFPGAPCLSPIISI